MIKSKNEISTKELKKYSKKNYSMTYKNGNFLLNSLTINLFKTKNKKDKRKSNQKTNNRLSVSINKENSLEE